METQNTENTVNTQNTENTENNQNNQSPETNPETNTPQTDQPTAATADTDSIDTLRQLLAEAEQRGYIRGVNSKLSEALDAPALFEDLARRQADPQNNNNIPTDKPTDRLSSKFLSNIRPTVWD